jgi:hypothetical protein
LLVSVAIFSVIWAWTVMVCWNAVIWLPIRDRRRQPAGWPSGPD